MVFFKNIDTYSLCQPLKNPPCKTEAYPLHTSKFSIGKVGVFHIYHVENAQNQALPDHGSRMVGQSDTHLLGIFHQAFATRGGEPSSALTFVFSTPCWEASPKHLMLTVERTVSVEKEASGIPVGVPVGVG
jgi:hypothetical protein